MTNSQNINTIQSDKPIKTPFAYIGYDKNESETAQNLIDILVNNHHLICYTPNLDNNIIEKDEENFLKHRNILNDIHASLIILLLSPDYMSSIIGLMELLESQLEQGKILPVIPIFITPTPLNSGTDYDDFLEQLKSKKQNNNTTENIKTIREQLSSIYPQMTKTKTYNSCSATLDKINDFLNDDTIPLTNDLCYEFFKEVINYLNCNFIYYTDYTKSSMPNFFRDLTIRLRNSIVDENTPFNDAKHILREKERLFFTQHHEFQLNLDDYHRVTQEECVVEGGKLVSINVSHPKLLLTMSVLEIGEKAFQYCENLEELIMPNCVITIGRYAFEYCFNFKKVYFSKKLKTIEEYAFSNCKNLEQIYLPEGLDTISKACFHGCYMLKSVYIPNTITVLERILFSYCMNLEEIDFPNNLEKIKKGCFSDCNKLSKINFPNTLTEIGSYAFLSTNLEEVVLPPNINHINDYAFADCKKLSKVMLTQNTPTLGDNVFEGCTSLNNEE